MFEEGGPRCYCLRRFHRHPAQPQSVRQQLSAIVVTVKPPSRAARLIQTLAGNDIIDGSTATSHDTYDGGSSNDVMKGGTGNTTFVDTPGSTDTIIDSGGIDTLDFSAPANPHGITIDLTLTSGQLQIVDGTNMCQVHGHHRKRHRQRILQRWHHRQLGQ